jgi:hypothetical protein
MTAIPDLVRRAERRELFDDDLVECLIIHGERALRYVTSWSVQQLQSDPEKLDAFRGCLFVIGSATKEVTEALRNWRSEVPWDDLADLACWRLQGPTLAPEPLESLCAFIREQLPAVLEDLRGLRTPRTS